MSRSRPLSVLLDEGAPAGAAEPFVGRGHRVIHHHDVLAPSAPDKVVCATAILNGAVLIAVDRDFRQMARRFGSSSGDPRYDKLNLIFLDCGGVQAPKRLAYVMSLIEHEWRVACEKAARTMWLEIGLHHVRSNR